MNRSRVVVTALCLTLASTAARATDGVIEINQARALAGGVTPGDTAGLPVTISVSGSYRLTSNLTTASTSVNVINVTASDVTIDLNGFTIKGPNLCSGTPTVCTSNGTGSGIDASVTRVTVRNGTITGLGNTGVALGSSSHVEGVHVSHSQRGISLTGAEGGSSTIIGCTTNLNHLSGIFLGEPGLVQGCTSTSNGQIGIQAQGGVVSGCYASKNGTYGIYLSSAHSLVTGSVAYLNASFGLSAFSGAVYSNCLFANNNSTSPEVSAGALQIGTNICNSAPCP